MEVLLSKGRPISKVAKELGISDHTTYRWRREYDGIRTDQAKRFKMLEKENDRLKKLVSSSRCSPCSSCCWPVVANRQRRSIYPVRKGLAEKFVRERTLFWRYKGRDSIRDAYLEPADYVYSGPVVVLVDVLSSSSAEEFAGAMQAIGRAAIVRD